MKPEIALKIDYDIFKEYTRGEIETARNEWISAYRDIAQSDSSKKELCDSLGGKNENSDRNSMLRQSRSRI